MQCFGFFYRWCFFFGLVYLPYPLYYSFTDEVTSLNRPWVALTPDNDDDDDDDEYHMLKTYHCLVPHIMGPVQLCTFHACGSSPLSLTHKSLMSSVPFVGYRQIVQTQTRCHIMQHLIRVSTVCL